MYFSNCVERWRGYITHVMDYVTKSQKKKNKKTLQYTQEVFSLKKQIIVNNNNF